MHVGWWWGGGLYIASSLYVVVSAIMRTVLYGSRKSRDE